MNQGLRLQLTINATAGRHTIRLSPRVFDPIGIWARLIQWTRNLDVHSIELVFDQVRLKPDTTGMSVRYRNVSPPAGLRGTGLRWRPASAGPGPFAAHHFLMAFFNSAI